MNIIDELKHDIERLEVERAIIDLESDIMSTSSHLVLPSQLIHLRDLKKRLQVLEIKLLLSDF